MALTVAAGQLGVAGLVLLAMGLERLLNVLLLGPLGATDSVRWFLSLACSGAGILLLVAASFSRTRTP
jgi:hypothetical protein